MRVPGVTELEVPGRRAPATGPQADEGSLSVAVCEVTGPTGQTITVPWFVDAAGQPRVRIRTDRPGTYHVRTPGGPSVEVTAGDDFAARGAVPWLGVAGRRLTGRMAGVGPDRDSVESDEPYLWLADTWWYALCDRVSIAELAELAESRVRAGFNTVQVVAGLLPEVEAFDPLGDLAGGWPWTDDLADLNPAWWQAADERIQLIIAAGLLPVIVGGWSYYLDDLGDERMVRHWREIIARWGAFPVVWCVAGEVGLPHYHELGRPDLSDRCKELADRWRNVTARVRGMDGYQNVMTAHPWPGHGFSSRTALGEVDALDLIWLQTGHLDRRAIEPSLMAITEELAQDHGRPVLNSEVCYEGIAAGSREELQRFLFFAHMLSGAAGHSYGAQGLWAFRRAEDSNPGLKWGEATWQQAAALPGAGQLGAAAIMMRSLDWAELVPAPDALNQHAGPGHWQCPYAARSDHELLAYFPPLSLIEPAVSLREISLNGLTPGTWLLQWWNPRTGAVADQHEVSVSEGDEVDLRSRTGSATPSMEDWVLIGRLTAGHGEARSPDHGNGP